MATIPIKHKTQDFNYIRTAGVLGMVGALVWLCGLVIQYAYELFPPGSGTLFVANQVLFLVAMTCTLMTIAGLWWANAGGNRYFGRISIALFFFGFASLIVGGVFALLSGNWDNFFFPIGGLTTMIGAPLTGIAVAIGGRWHGWLRYAPLLHGLYYVLGIMVLPPVLLGRNEPTLLLEGLWMATLFLLGYALYAAD